VLATAVALARPALFTSLDSASYDTLLRWSRWKTPDDRIVIVDIDEKSLSEVGQWPWRRDVMGELITKLRDKGATIVALDIVFSEPDRYQSVIPIGDPSNPRRISGTPDELLASDLRAGKVILGYAATFEPGASTGGRCILDPLNLATLHSQDPDEDQPLFEATSAVCNLPMLMQPGVKSGFMNAAPDGDGILRRAPLLIELEGHVYPSLATAAVLTATNVRDTALWVSTINSSLLMLDDGIVPVDGRSNLLLRYRGKKRTFPYLSAADVLSGQVPEAAVRDKIVFVGTTALGTREVVATPLDTLFVGVEVQATIADNLLQQDFLHRPVGGSTFESLSALVAGLIVTVAVTSLGLVSGGSAGALALVVLWAGAAWLLETQGLFLSPLFPSTSVVLAFATMTIGKFGVERHRAETAIRQIDGAVQRAEEAGHQKSNAQRLMIETLLSLTETRDTETGKHSRRTSQYARVLAMELSKHPSFDKYLTSERIDLLASLAPLHDIGKVGVPDAVLNKPGALTPEEFAEMKRHPIYGRDVILRAEKEAGITDDGILAMAKEIVYTHHEKWDGTGYPNGLRGSDIPVPGRVMALVDVYDACTTRSLYRQPMSHDQVISFISAGRGTHFDPAVVDAFLNVAPVLLIVSQEGDLRRYDL
jgi:CHASE2 domain-containing sensor protein